MRLDALVTLLVSTWLSSVHAGDIPARLLEGDRSIEALLRVPKRLPLGKSTVYCEALVRKNGWPEYFICYSLPGTAPANLVRAVEAAGRLTRFAPARRDGIPADVYMMLMVHVRITDSGPLVLAVPNNGVDATRYGLLYTAPQRFNEFYWGDESGLLRKKARRDVIWQKLQIDEHGKITQYSVTNTSDAPMAVVRQIEQQIGRMDFMPGFFEGKPVPMLYMEPAFRMVY